MEKEEKKAVLPNVLKVAVTRDDNPKDFKVGMYVHFDWLKELFNIYFDNEEYKNTTLANLYTDLCDKVIEQCTKELTADFGIISGAVKPKKSGLDLTLKRISELLTENEQLKSDLRDMKASHATLSELLMQKDDEIEKLRSGEVEYKSGIKDGVYVVFKDGSYSSWKDTKEELSKLDKKNVECLGIVWNNHTFGVELHDLIRKVNLLEVDSDGANPITSVSPSQNAFEALFDFNPVYHTKCLRQTSLSFCLPKGKYIPTVGQFAAIYNFIGDLSEALEAVGGDSLFDGDYWTSNRWNEDWFYCVSMEHRNFETKSGSVKEANVRLVTDFNI